MLSHPINANSAKPGEMTRLLLSTTRDAPTHKPTQRDEKSLTASHHRKHAHRNGRVEQHESSAAEVPHPLVLTLVEPVRAAWRFDTLFHALHMRDAGCTNPVAFHAVHTENVCELVVPESMSVFASGPANNVGQSAAS